MNKILFIDDSQLVLKTVRNLLNSAEFQLMTAENGLDGLCEMVEHKPDVVFIKANVPKLDGFQFCALVKGNAEYSHIPVYVVLDHDDYLERSKALALGAEAVFNKPFGQGELMALITKQQVVAA